MEQKPINEKVEKIDKDGVSGLTNDKKELLKKHLGSIPSKVDLNKVREWWKYD